VDNAGTDSGVWFRGNGADGKTVYVDTPGDDFERGSVNQFAFTFPGGQIRKLTSLTIGIDGEDALCIESVSLSVNAGDSYPIVDYYASSPLEGDVMTDFIHEHPGKGVIWLSENVYEGFDDVSFHDGEYTVEDIGPIAAPYYRPGQHCHRRLGGLLRYYANEAA